MSAAGKLLSSVVCSDLACLCHCLHAAATLPRLCCHFYLWHLIFLICDVNLICGLVELFNIDIAGIVRTPRFHCFGTFYVFDVGINIRIPLSRLIRLPSTKDVPSALNLSTSIIVLGREILLSRLLPGFMSHFLMSLDLISRKHSEACVYTASGKIRRIIFLTRASKFLDHLELTLSVLNIDK